MMYKTLFSLALALCLSVAHAGIVIMGTRVVYPGEQKNISVKLLNRSQSPSLVQAWVGSAEDPDNANTKTPFVLMPPISRVDANKEQILRIRHTGEYLAQDRETLFYFNVLDIPPKPKSNEGALQNYLQFVVHSRLKFFYRPAKLPYPVQDAYAKVKWHISGKTLTADNPTPYFISYANVAVKQGESVNPTKKAGMVAPFSQMQFELTSMPDIKQAGEVEWQIINDYGGFYTNRSAWTH